MVGNRTNLPGHDRSSHGGAVAVVDGTLQVTGTRFERNQAGYVGGAIYAIGTRADAGAQVTVTGATFLANQAVADPCCGNGNATEAGAIHVEDFSVLTLQRSLLVGNRADWGGALSSYRATMDVRDSVFQANQMTVAKPDGGFGGAIAVLSGGGAADTAPLPGRLLLSGAFVQGGGAVTQPASRGGCIGAFGETGRVYGGGGAVDPLTLAKSRAVVEIRRSVLADCDAGTASASGVGGGLDGSFVDLTLADSLLIDSDARGGGAGGALALRSDSLARVDRTSFAHDSAGFSGGAIKVQGSTLQVAEGRFLGNDVVPGAGEPLAGSRGSSIHSLPQADPVHPTDARGVVARSLFADDLGVPLFENDNPGEPRNGLRYDGNRFAGGIFGATVWLGQGLPGGATVDQLNALAIPHGFDSVRKSEQPNVRASGVRDGALIAVPSPRGVGAGATAGTAILAYAWTGGSATLAGQSLAARTGLLEVPAGEYALVVDGSEVARTRTP
jgi:predicted outer membrane repeat protein